MSTSIDPDLHEFGSWPASELQRELIRLLSVADSQFKFGQTMTSSTPRRAGRNACLAKQPHDKGTKHEPQDERTRFLTTEAPPE